MTTLTGITEQKLAGTVDHTSFELAMFGAVLQLATVLGVWHTQTSAHTCLGDPIGCLSDLGAADPWGRTALLTLCFSAFTWALSVYRGSEEGTSDPSIVDRLWSINPLVYTLHFFFSAGGMESGNHRLQVMTALVTLWSSRLTWNFWRKGGFSGGEDYRWIEVRKWFPGVQFEIFNLVFICFFQQCVNMMNFESKTRSFVSKTRNCAFKMMDCAGARSSRSARPRRTPSSRESRGTASITSPRCSTYCSCWARPWRTRRCSRKMMIFVCKMMNFLLKMMNFRRFGFQTEKYRRINAGIALGAGE